MENKRKTSDSIASFLRPAFVYFNARNRKSSSGAEPMAKRSFRKSKQKRRNYKRRGTRRHGRRFIQLQTTKTKTVKLRLTKRFMFDFDNVSGAGTGDKSYLYGYAFQANSLSDPTLTLGTNLPKALDQWAAFYTRYQVVYSKATVRYAYEGTTVPIVVALGVTRATDETTARDMYGTCFTNAPIEALREVPGYKLQLSTQEADKNIITRDCRPLRWYEKSEQTDMWGDLSATPGDIETAENLYYCLYAQGANNTVTGAWGANKLLTCTIEMEFLIKLKEPVNLARSAI